MIALVLIVVIGPVARADTPPPGTGVTECANLYLCVGTSDPGSTPAPGQTLGSSSGGSGDGTPMCSWNGQQWPCWDNDLGWFRTSDGCYYKAEVPQPAAGAAEWQGHDPSTGAIYQVNCRQTGGGLTPRQPVFLAQSPGGPPPDNKPQLGATAEKLIGFDHPDLHAAPAITAVVGMPVWLWYTTKDPNTAAGPLTATAPGIRISVTATAVLDHVTWDTDDTTGGKTCTGPGTPYRQGATPDAGACLYTYASSSAVKHGKPYALTATLWFHVTAKASDGSVVPVPEDPYPVRTVVPLDLNVAEVQALN